MRLRYSEQLVRSLRALHLDPLADRMMLYRYAAPEGREVLINQLELIATRLKPNNFLINVIHQVEEGIYNDWESTMPWYPHYPLKPPPKPPEAQKEPPPKEHQEPPPPAPPKKYQESQQ